MRPVQIQTKICVGDRRVAVISAAQPDGNFRPVVERILVHRPCLFATQFAPNTVQLLLVKCDSLARIHG